MALLGVVAAGLLISGGIRMLPSCSSDQSTTLLETILKDKIAIKGNPTPINIRTKSGWLFGRSYECEADLSGITDADSFFGLKPKSVDYSIYFTDEGRLFVSAKIVPGF
jgi:hypothetical protein